MKSIILIFISLNAVHHISCQVQSSFIEPLENGTCGISTGGPLVQQLTTTISYVGSLFWSDDGEKIAYVDRFAPGYGRYTPNDGRFNHINIDEGREAIVIFPVKNTTGLKFLIGIDNRLVLADVIGSDNNYTSKLYELLIVSDDYERFATGKCDTKGRLWYVSDQNALFPHGNLYKIDNLNRPEVMFEVINIGAGMAWTKDDKYFYLVDHGFGTINKFDFDVSNGTIRNPKIVFDARTHPDLFGSPFGLAIDTDGHLWTSMDGSIIQFDEESNSILKNIAMPASRITSLEFGGLDKKTLYVGTAKEEGQSASGAIFSVSGLGVTGISDNDAVIPEKYRNL